MATETKTVFSHITKDARVCGGKACIDYTRIRVIDIVQLKREGKTPEEMRDIFAVPLTLSQIYSALAYADENPEEIEADFAAGLRALEDLERDRADFLKQRSGR